MFGIYLRNDCLGYGDWDACAGELDRLVANLNETAAFVRRYRGEPLSPDASDVWDLVDHHEMLQSMECHTPYPDRCYYWED